MSTNVTFRIELVAHHPIESESHARRACHHCARFQLDREPLAQSPVKLSVGIVNLEASQDVVVPDLLTVPSRRSQT